MSGASRPSEYVTNQNWQSYSGASWNINFSNRGIKGFGHWKLQAKFEWKDSENIHYDNFELWRLALDYLVFVGSVNLGSFVLSIYRNRV